MRKIYLYVNVYAVAISHFDTIYRIILEEELHIHNAYITINTITSLIQ